MKTLARYIVPLVAMLAVLPCAAQQKYWVYFADKPDRSHNPYEYLHPQAVERRLAAGALLVDETDYPVASQYIAAVREIADSLGNASRWLNAVAAWATPAQVGKLEALPFVKTVVAMRAAPMVAQVQEEVEMDSALERLRMAQLHSLRPWAKALQDTFAGRGITIAVFDVGFKDVDNHPAFRHLVERNQVRATWDFLRKRESVYRTGTHGTMVLSCIAGRYHGQPMGMAQDATFLLARTERLLTESKGEEDAWVAAAEWAERLGAHIISSSLGYSDRRYFPEDMDGTSPVARAGNLAAKKGVLVVSAAGNEGTIAWKYHVTPADADSVLSVGGVHPYWLRHINFSSYGPSADFRVKPNVSATGRAIVASPGKAKYTSAIGTSFSTPLVAGLAACMMEKDSTLRGMKAFKKLEQSGHLYPYYDYAHGYGIPMMPPQQAAPKLEGRTPVFDDVEVDSAMFKAERKHGSVHLRYTGPKPVYRYDETERTPPEPEDSLYRTYALPYMYYHIEHNGRLLEYGVTDIREELLLTIVPDAQPEDYREPHVVIDPNKYPQGSILRTRIKKHIIEEKLR